MAFLDAQGLLAIGFKSLGHTVLVSDKASILNPANITVGDHVRVDDFCVLDARDGDIVLGEYVHVACYCELVGPVRMSDFSGLSSRVSIEGPAVLGKHVIVGAGAVIQGGVEIGEGSAIGALALVADSCGPYGVFSGNPAKWIKARSEKTRELEAALKGRTPGS